MKTKTVESMKVLYAAQELTIPEIGHFGDIHCPGLSAEAEKQGLAVTGPWIFIYYNLATNITDRFWAEFSLPVSDMDDYAGAYGYKTLPPFSCASSLYKGDLHHLFTEGYQPLVREIIRAGLRFTGESREVYHSWIGPDSRENLIELQFGVI